MKLKKSVLSILTGFLLLSPMTVIADNNQNNIVQISNQKKIVFLPSGETNDVTTINVEGYNYLKLRDMEMGKRASVSYDANTKEITVKNNKSSEIYKIKSNELKKDNQTISLIAPTVNKDGYTYLSIRDWANMIDFDVKSFEANRIELIEKEVAKASTKELKNNEDLKAEEKNIEQVDVEDKKESKDLPQWYIDEVEKDYDKNGIPYANFLARTRGIPGDKFMDMLGEKYGLSEDTTMAYKLTGGFDSTSTYVIMNKGEAFKMNGNLEKLREGGIVKGFEFKSLTPIINTITGEWVGSKLQMKINGNGYWNSSVYIGDITDSKYDKSMVLQSAGEAAEYNGFKSTNEIDFIMFSMDGRDSNGNLQGINLVYFTK